MRHALLRLGIMLHDPIAHVLQLGVTLDELLVRLEEQGAQLALALDQRVHVGREPIDVAGLLADRLVEHVALVRGIVGSQLKHLLRLERQPLVLRRLVNLQAIRQQAGR
jgi:hypothetical protein